MKTASEKNIIQQIWRTICRRLFLIIAVLLLVVLSGMLATIMITPKFEATMSILISRDRIDPQINPSDKSAETTPTLISDEEFNSELELIESSQVIAGVVNDLDLVNNQKPKPDTRFSGFRNKFKTTIYKILGRESEAAAAVPDAYADERTVNQIGGGLSVTSNKKSRVIRVAYTDTDPDRAKKFLESLYEKYVALHIQISEKPQAGQVFSKESDKYNTKLNSSTKILKNFDEQNGVSGAQGGVQRELLLKQFYDAQAQASAADTEIRETEKRIASLKEKIAAQPEQIQTGSVSKYVSAVDGMKNELTQLQQQRTQLMQKYQPNSRFVTDNQQRIDQIKKSIDEELKNPPQEKSFALNDLRRRLESDLTNAQTNISALRQRQTDLTARAAKLRTQVGFINSKSIERTGLERERSVNEEAYLLYQKKARENEISQALSREQVMNFSVVDAPRTNGEQKSPKMLINLLVLIATGLFAGFASAVVLEKITEGDEQTINSRSALEQRFDLPVLASIPVILLPKDVEISAEPKRLNLPPVRSGRKIQQ